MGFGVRVGVRVRVKVRVGPRLGLWVELRRRRQLGFGVGIS